MFRTVGLAAISLGVLCGCGGSGGAGSGDTTTAPAATGSTTAATTGSTAVSAPAASLPSISDLEAEGATRVEDLGEPDWLVLAGGSAWAAGVGKGVGRLDGKTGKLLSSVDVPVPICLAMDAGFKSVWVGSCGTPVISRIDPRTAKVVATIALSVEDLAHESSLAAGEGGVWALSSGAETNLVKIDPKTNTVAATYPMPPGAAAVRAAFGALWITDANTNMLLRVDPQDGTVKKEIPVGQVPRFLAVGADGVWVLNQADGSVSHVDPATDTVVATIPVDDGRVDGGDIAVGGGAVWARVTSSLVAKIDPRSDSVVARYGLPAGSGSVAADGRAVWISAHDVSSVWRLPLR
jgi:YVTN family beta-propeller protein